MEPKPPSTNPSEVQCTIPIGYFDQKIKTHPEIRKIPVQTFFFKKSGFYSKYNKSWFSLIKKAKICIDDG
jgi:hypothetical protein